jgi:hypothetical protein
MSNVARQPFSGMPHMTYGTLGSPFDACATSHHPQLQRHASLNAAFLFFFSSSFIISHLNLEMLIQRPP